MRSGPGGARVGGGAALAGTALVASVLAATALALRPPAPRSVLADPSQFSAGRALLELEGLERAAGGAHPVASAANRRVREWVVGELRARGLAPRVEEALACGRYRACAPVANVVARIPGRSPARPVLLVAHYDSVGAGPGAADDGSGVAIALEAARALLAEPADRDVVLLLDDGEEAGLVGAQAFLSDPVAREVGAVVNLEARGTSGPSLLFETAGPSAFTARLFGPGARVKVASSLFPAAYERLPNDTDLTVLRELGVPGANLAFVGGATRYHTPRDDLDHLDPRSLEHQGENALALVRALAASDLERPPPGEAVYFDVLGLAVLRLPRPGATALAFATAVVAIGAAALSVRRKRTRLGAVALGAVAPLLALAAACAAGYLSSRALGLSPIERPWVAHPAPLESAFLLSGAAAGALPAAALGGKAGPAGLRAGLALSLALLAAIASLAFPGGSHLLLVPALAASALGVVGCFRGASFGVGADSAAAAAGALVLFPAAWLLYPAMGQGAGPLVAACAAAAVLPLAPSFAQLSRRARIGAAAAPAILAAALAGLARIEPAADANHPERVVLSFREDADRGRARLLATADLGRLPPSVRAAAAFSPSPRMPAGLLTDPPSFEAEVLALHLPGPELSPMEVAVQGGRLRLRGRLRSPRGATEALVALPPGVEVESFSFDGVAVPRATGRRTRGSRGATVYRRLGLSPEGTEVEMAIASPGPLEVEIADASPGLPPEWAAAAAARDRAAVSAQRGDETLVSRTVSLRPR